MTAIEKFLPHYTYEDYVKWEGKWELIDGVIYAMSPAPALNHQRVCMNLGAQFVDQLKSCSKCKAYLPVDYLVANDTVLQPDILIICGKVKPNYLDFPPELVVEVLSPSTALKDKHTKFNIYQAQKIPYYIIISPPKQNVEIYQYLDDKYELVLEGKDIHFEFSFESCKASIDFKEIWD